MGFFNEKLIKLGINPDDFAQGTKITLFDSVGMLIEGHKGVYSYENTCITVRVKKRSVEISGENLSIASLNNTEIFIRGDIAGVRYV